MQSGKIAPVFRQFFREALSSRSATDSHSQQQQQSPQEEPDREPTPEEANAALEALRQQDEFKKNDLRAELLSVEGRAAIVVSDRGGAQLKSIRGREILRLLDGSKVGRLGPYRGRILDRRV